MKVTLVLCVLALLVAVVFGSGGHDAGGHGDAHAAGGHDDAHGASHGADAAHGDTAHGDAHGDDGHGSATSLQMCSTLFSFAVIAAFNKLW